MTNFERYRYPDRDWPPTLRAALAAIAAGPLRSVPGGFIPTAAEIIAAHATPLPANSVAALARRHAVRIIRRRRGVRVAVITPRGKYIHGRLAEDHADTVQP